MAPLPAALQPSPPAAVAPPSPLQLEAAARTYLHGGGVCGGLPNVAALATALMRRAATGSPGVRQAAASLVGRYVAWLPAASLQLERKLHPEVGPFAQPSFIGKDRDPLIRDPLSLSLLTLKAILSLIDSN